MELRAMTPDDLDEVLALQREGSVLGLGHIFPQQTHPFPTASVRAGWERELGDCGIECFVVLDAAQLVSGYVATRSGELLHFGTAVRTWGTGLAGEAHDAAVARLRRQGHAVPWLRVFEQNVRARRFYERRGWEATGEQSRTGFPPHPVLLTYRLGGP